MRMYAHLSPKSLRRRRDMNTKTHAWCCVCSRAFTKHIYKNNHGHDKATGTDAHPLRDITGSLANGATPAADMFRDLQPGRSEPTRQDGIVPGEVPPNAQHQERDLPVEDRNDDQPRDQVASNKRRHPDNNTDPADLGTQEMQADDHDTSSSEELDDSDNSGQVPCQMLRPVVGKKAQYVRSLFSWIGFLLFKWQVANNISKRALEPLLLLFSAVLSIAGGQEVAAAVPEVFPKSVHKMKKWFGLDQANDFQRMVCCDSCYRVVANDETMYYTDRRGKKVPRRCRGDVVKGGKVLTCNEELFDGIKKENGKMEYTPKHIFCYKPLSKSLDSLLSRPGILDKCNEWRKRRSTPGEYSDVYDGSVWQTFVENGFLREETSLALQLNLDWFQPFTRRNNISVGAIYIAVLNLPREERYKLENIILLGIIPNLTKEPSNLEYFLRPLVEELKTFYGDGIHLPRLDRVIRCALICISCDLPATRKVCGFLAYSARLGCSRCKLDFQGGKSRNCGGGWQKPLWPKRSAKVHRREVEKIRAAAPEKRAELELKLGARYTPLLDLDYYHPIKFCAIDAMHNLFLGTAKTFMKLLKDKFLTDKDLDTIDERLQHFKQGLSDEWVVENMKSNMGMLTAAEWRHWTLVSSGYCLQGLIDDEYLKVWEHFVQACRHLSPAYIEGQVLDKVDMHLKEFGKGIARLFGKDKVTPNMHMQMHTTEVVKEYGPLYACWLFAFERYNGALGDIQTNNRQIEVQIMRRFMEASLADCLEDKLPEQHAPEFAHMLPSRKRVNLTVPETLRVPRAPLAECEELWSNCKGIVTRTTDKQEKGGPACAFYPDDLEFLLQTYRVMYPSYGASLEDKYIVAKLYNKFESLEYGPNHYARATQGRSNKLGWIMANWCAPTEEEQVLRPGLIHYFLKHNLVDRETKEIRSHYFARVTWYKPWTLPSPYIKPLTLWHKDRFEPASWASFLPISRIQGRFGCVIKKDHIVVAPLATKVYV